MRYYQDMIRIAEKETANGRIVLMPFVALNPGQQLSELKTMLDDMHRQKIDMADDIIVVGLHIGESTAREIEYAKERGKSILYWTDHFGAMS